MDKSLGLRAEIIAAAIKVGVVDNNDVVTSLQAELEYDVHNPFAVTLTFLTSSGKVAWVLSRDVLAVGLDQPAGDGDIHIWPSYDQDGQPVVVIELESPDGDALIELRDEDIVRFYDRTLMLVPLGAESMDATIESTIAAILAVEGA